MKPLSERLEMEAESWESWNRDFPEDQSPLTPVLLREAAAIAKRYEDSQGINCDEEGFLFASFMPNRRVRIVPEGEK